MSIIFLFDFKNTYRHQVRSVSHEDWLEPLDGAETTLSVALQTSVELFDQGDYVLTWQ